MKKDRYIHGRKVITCRPPLRRDNALIVVVIVLGITVVIGIILLAVVIYSQYS